MPLGIFAGSLAYEKKFVELALGPARLLEFVGRQLLLPQVRDRFLFLAGLEIALHLGLLRAFEFLQLCLQQAAAFEGGRFAGGAEVQFRSGDSCRCVLPDAAPDLLRFGVEGNHLCADACELHGQGLQFLQLGPLLQLAHAQHSLQGEDEGHRLSRQRQQRRQRLLDGGLVVLVLLQERIDGRLRRDGLIQ